MPAPHPFLTFKTRLSVIFFTQSFTVFSTLQERKVETSVRDGIALDDLNAACHRPPLWGATPRAQCNPIWVIHAALHLVANPPHQSKSLPTIRPYADSIYSNRAAPDFNITAPPPDLSIRPRTHDALPTMHSLCLGDAQRLKGRRPLGPAKDLRCVANEHPRHPQPYFARD